MGKKGNLAVDTRNLCFLCYRPTKIISAGVNSRKKDNKVFSLRGVSRYMNVNFRKMMMMVPKKDGPLGDQDEATGKFPHVVVTVCSRCSTVTDEFTKLFQYLEFTQMKINACVRNMNELMKKSDSNSRLVEKFQKKMKTTGKTEWEIVEKIRKELAEKCSSNLKGVLPRVRIEKLRNDPPPPPIVKRKDKGTIYSKPGPRSRKRGLSASKKVKSTSPKDNDNAKTSFSGRSMLASITNSEKNESGLPGERFQCLHCDQTFNDTTGLRVHIVMDHREQFFSMLKNPDVSEDDFKIAVERLFQDVRKITAHCGNQSESSVSYVCTCCGKPFDVIIDTYVHMVQLHHDVLSSRLQTIQKDLASSKKTAKQSMPDPTTTKSERKKRGPYKKKNMDASKTTSNSMTDVPASSLHDMSSTSTNSAKKNKLKNAKTGVTAVRSAKAENKPEYPRICKCGVTLSRPGTWRKHHQLFRCKLKIKTNTSSEVKKKAVSTKHPVLKRAKNSVGFPRTCDCGVRLTLRSSWTNHVKFHCKLKIGPTPEPKVSRAEKRKLLFEAAANKSIRAALTKNKRREGKTALTKNKGREAKTELTNNKGSEAKATVTRNMGKEGRIGHTIEKNIKATKKKGVKKYQRVCKCGSVLNSEKSWKAHQRKSCKLKDISMTAEAMDALNACVEIEEVPVDITPAGELCLSNVITTINDSSYPEVVSTSSGGGVIKGLHQIANFQASFRKEKEDETIKTIESSSFSELFSPYFPIKIQLAEIDVGLGKVLQTYRKFPGNISGCPFCGRGFTQITELQNHMVEGHFEEVLSQLKRLITPSTLGQDSYTIDLHPGYQVKKENFMEADLSSNDVNMTGSEESNDYQSYMEEGADEHEVSVTPKEEMVRLRAHENDQSMDSAIEDYNQFMILP